MRVLIFGTCYAAKPEQFQLVQQWMHLHRDINPGVDLLLVDSSCPYHAAIEDLVVSADGIQMINFPNNIGHLGRSGRDGWGRAFCEGLIWAVHQGYDYAVHIEGDSLFRHPVIKFCEFMQKHDLRSFVCGVNGTKFKEFEWVETGIMFLQVAYMRDSNFVERYDWQDGASKKYPHTPEAVIYEMLAEDGALSVVPIKVMRDDRRVLTKDNVGGYDWITHTTPEIFATFVSNSMVNA